MRLEKCKYPLVRRNSQMNPNSACEKSPTICMGTWTALNFHISSRLCGIPQAREIPSWLLLFLGAYSILAAVKCHSRLMLIRKKLLMFLMNCSSIICNDRHIAIYIYTWREVNSREWNSSIIKAWYQQI